MIEYLGNCNHLVNWNEFIKELETIKPMIGYQFDEDRSSSADPAVLETASAWRLAGYPMDNKTEKSPIAWEAWYSGMHFDNSITDRICSYLKIIPIDVSMATRLVPGRFAPWHWDIRNKETIDKFNSYGKPIIRLHIHMSKPEPGHVFFVKEHCFTNKKQGSMYKWSAWTDYHAGGNCGLTSKYQFSIIGVNQ